MKQLILVGGPGLSSTLCTPDGLILESYEAMKESLRRRKSMSVGTAECYLGHIARFHEYIYTAWLLGTSPTYDNLQVLLDHYEDYLLFGTQSSISVVYEIARLTGKSAPTSPSSLPVIEAAIKLFLRFSDQKARKGNNEKLFTFYAPNTVEPISSGQASRLKMSSKLAGLVRGGPQKRRAAGEGIFRSTKSSRAHNSTHKPIGDRAFPIDSIVSLIDCCSSYRDKALYAFLASSGCRSFEAMQLTWSDLSPSKHEAYLVDPFSRLNSGITDEEFRQLRWKGRTHYETFMIYPWSDIFWSNLRKYLDIEYIPDTGHDFVFQILSGPNRGRPYFTSDRASRTRAFKERSEKAGVPLPKNVSIHSLRHGFAMYCLNDHPISDGGRGFSLVQVNKMLAQAHLNSTRIYAKADSKRIHRELDFNRELHIEASKKSENDAIRDSLHQRNKE
ncbi:site-specific integrase [Pseudomonas tremae]|uniref:tyrosine-type recombinase/integrase n=1 Tax=Pseudomonas syringae group TaxID=136849 RepID=UPI0002D6F154|nr:MULTISPECIES: site-specific integrase [Pseudomonas syringae group]MCQ3018076.1 site-specific integrase [Pseudomonas tremae]QGL58977.1 tyrosine-type recombinase/integrase [Pseudomonas coronafaciens pv. oryzae str. 1_6]RMM35817.1 Tyr recombinase activity site-specific recombination Tyr recombinase activity [Pseudomonas coronafaciens pv. oryzae]